MPYSSVLYLYRMNVKAKKPWDVCIVQKLMFSFPLCKSITYVAFKTFLVFITKSSKADMIFYIPFTLIYFSHSLLQHTHTLLAISSIIYVIFDVVIFNLSNVSAVALSLS